MTTTELKWYITSQIGSKISKNKILSNKPLYRKLQAQLQMRNIEDILLYLNNIGFTIITKQEKEIISEPVKTYYIEPQTYEKPKDTHIEDSLFKQYSTERFFNKNKLYEAQINERRREKIKNSLSKPYYRENTDYSSIW